MMQPRSNTLADLPSPGRGALHVRATPISQRGIHASVGHRRSKGSVHVLQPEEVADRPPIIALNLVLQPLATSFAWEWHEQRYISSQRTHRRKRRLLVPQLGHRSHDRCSRLQREEVLQRARGGAAQGRRPPATCAHAVEHVRLQPPVRRDHQPRPCTLPSAHPLERCPRVIVHRTVGEAEIALIAGAHVQRQISLSGQAKVHSRAELLLHSAIRGQVGAARNTAPRHVP
eukprot:scaffold52568_cov60-Phaeocystis_antarctica.AAC.4